MQENWIGRSDGVNFGFPYELDGERRQLRVFTTRADTIMGVTFVAVAAEHPLADASARAAIRSSPHSSKSARKGGVSEAELATAEKKGMADRLLRHASADGRAGGGVGRQLRADGLRRRRRDGRARRTTSAISRSRRKYGLPIKQCRGGGRRRARERQPWMPRTWSTACCVNTGKYDGLDYEARRRCHRRRSQSEEARRQADYLSPARLGHQPPALLGHADPDHPLRGLRLRARAGRRICPSCCRRIWCPTAAAIRSTRTSASWPASVRSAASPRGARRTRWIRSSTRPGTTCAIARPVRTRHGRCAQRLLDADGPVHRRHRACRAASALRALLDQGDARSGAREVRRAVHAPVHAGHAAGRVLLSRGGRAASAAGSIRPKSKCATTRRAGPLGAVAREDGAARDARRHREDVEVQEQRGRAAATSSSASAPTPRAPT